MKPLPLFPALIRMLCNPVLAFIKAFRLRGSIDSLKRAALAKFDSVLLCKAKKELWESDCSTILCDAGLSFRIRRDSEKRTQAAADLDDLLQAFDKLDELDNIPDIFCEATDLVILPPIVVDNCTAIVQRNSATLDILTSKLDFLSSEVSALCSKLGKASDTSLLHRPPQVSSPSHINSGQSQPSSTHRQENLIVFGIEEQSMTATMESVKEMLQFVVGRPTPVKDLFRIGRYKKPGDGLSLLSHPRPIILKLVSPWDRRLVLANRFSLKNYDVSGVYIREDLSPDERKVRMQRRREKNAGKGHVSSLADHSKSELNVTIEATGHGPGAGDQASPELSN